MKKRASLTFFTFIITIIIILIGSVVILLFAYNNANRALKEHFDSLASMEIHETEVKDTTLQENIDRTTIPSDDLDSVVDSDLESDQEISPEEFPRLFYDGQFELPINGATGFAPVFMPVRQLPDSYSYTEGHLYAGTGFTIVDEQDEWWYIEAEEVNGWVLHAYCFINLPDVLPSIVYNVTNAHSSVFLSSGYPIPNVSGLRLYESFSFNYRLNQEEFIAPILYSTAKRIANAQQKALADGNTLILYEAFRPLSTQMLIVDSLTWLSNENDVVHQGLNQPPWHLGWFIATGVSTHQRGTAIDVSLAKINEQETITVGDYSVIVVTDYTEHMMPTSIHELSVQAVVFTSPVTHADPYGWQQATFSHTMTEAAITLQRYLTEAGFTPLASEWWHFDDPASMSRIRYNSSNGDFVLSQIFSRVPEAFVYTQ